MVPSRDIRLFGTDEPVEPPVLLAAGPLTAELDSGGLRYIRFEGKEVLRSIAFLVRDRNWGTYGAQLSGLQIDHGDGEFSVAYEAECRIRSRRSAIRRGSRARMTGPSSSKRWARG